MFNEDRLISALKYKGVPSKKIPSIVRIVHVTNDIFEEAQARCGAEADYRPTTEEEPVSVEYRRLLCTICTRDLDLIIRYSEMGWIQRTPTTLDAIRSELLERALVRSDRKKKSTER